MITLYAVSTRNSSMKLTEDQSNHIVLRVKRKPNIKDSDISTKQRNLNPRPWLWPSFLTVCETQQWRQHSVNTTT